MSVSHCQYFLILQITFGDYFRVHILARQQFPQALRSLKHSVLYRDITTGIDHYRGNAYQSYYRPYGCHIACRENVSCTRKASGIATGPTFSVPYSRASSSTKLSSSL